METIGICSKIKNVYNFVGGETDNGICYKNMNAWYNNTDEVIYIGEYELGAFANKEVPYKSLWTKNKWLKYVKEHIADTYPYEKEMVQCKQFIEYIAERCLDLADWQDLTTILFDLDDDETWIIDNWLEYKLNH